MDVVLGNPRVTLLRYVGGEDVRVKDAPTAAEIAGLGDDYYLDLPGDPLSAGCTYGQALLIPKWPSAARFSTSTLARPRPPATAPPPLAPAASARRGTRADDGSPATG